VYLFIRATKSGAHPIEHVAAMANTLRRDYDVFRCSLPPSLYVQPHNSASPIPPMSCLSSDRESAAIAAHIHLVADCGEMVLSRSLCSLSSQDGIFDRAENGRLRVRAAQHAARIGLALLRNHGRLPFACPLRGQNLAIFCLLAAATSLFDYLDGPAPPPAVGGEDDRREKLESLHEVLLVVKELVGQSGRPWMLYVAHTALVVCTPGGRTLIFFNIDRTLPTSKSPSLASWPDPSARHPLKLSWTDTSALLRPHGRTQPTPSQPTT
jgi:hypothetical protein